MNKEMVELINNQVNFEIYSGHIYLNMSCYCKAEGLDGFGTWFYVQYQEEMTHANKLINYLLDKGYTPIITNWQENPGTEYSSILEVAEISLMHEKVISSRFDYMMNIAQEVKDYSTINLFQWFIDEQVEEEAKFETMVQKIKTYGDKELYLLNKEHGERVFEDDTI